MKRLFISQPTKGKTREEIRKGMEEAIALAEQYLGEKVDVVNSCAIDSSDIANPLWLLGKSLEKLATADIAYFAEGWKENRGSYIESLVAAEYGIPILTKDKMVEGKDGKVIETEIKNGAEAQTENSAPEKKPRRRKKAE